MVAPYCNSRVVLTCPPPRRNPHPKGAVIDTSVQTSTRRHTMAIALSHGGPTMYQSPERSRHVLVGTIRGVMRLERDADGPGWHLAERVLPDKHIHALLIE